MLSHNSDFSSRNWKFLSCNSEFKVRISEIFYMNTLFSSELHFFSELRVYILQLQVITIADFFLNFKLWFFFLKIEEKLENWEKTVWTVRYELRIGESELWDK